MPTDPARPSPQRAVVVSGLRVLLADDCQASRHLTRDILGHLGIRPTMATNGADAVRMALDGDFDLILIDVELAGLDGIVATARIRDFESAHPARRRVCVVGLTLNELVKAEATLLRIGMDAVLEKHSGFLAMSACLRKVCPGGFASLPGRAASPGAPP